MAKNSKESKQEDKVKKLAERPNRELKEFAVTFIAGLALIVIAFLFIGFGGAEEATEETLFENTAVEAAADDLATRLGIDKSMIEVGNVEERTWPDACLGVPQPEEFCAQMLTDGFLVELEYQDTEFEYRTDESGGTVRLER